MITATDALTDEVRWSFSSGHPLSSAHGLLLDALEGSNSSLDIAGEPLISEDEFIFCTPDWTLYSFDKKHGLKILPVPPHELVQSTPTVVNGALILGSVSTSVYLLDANSGDLVRTFDSRNESYSADLFGKEDIWQFLEFTVGERKDLDYLFVLRKDYSIKSVSMASGALLWNVSVADIQVHHINHHPDRILRLPAAQEKNLKNEPTTQPLRWPAALPASHMEHLETSSEEMQDVPWITSFRGTLISAGIALVVIIIVSSVFWVKAPQKKIGEEKQAGKKRKPRKAKTGAVISQEGPVQVNNAPLESSINLNPQSVADVQILSNDPNSEETALGRLRVLTTKRIGFGSNGTMVFEGYLDKRHVAVKRMLRQYYDKAEKEINHLIRSDEHPNILRYYHLESDAHFVYVALERCRFSLNDLVLAKTVKRIGNNVKDLTEELNKEELKIAIANAGNDEDFFLWDEWDRPSRQLLQLMMDILAGLAHLHEMGIVHRDLKPHNVLVSNKQLRAKLSDMGISKQLADGETILNSQSTGLGSSGWQAPEQLTRKDPQTTSMDLFSFGCVLFFSISGGHHPFGTYFERDHNILNGRFDLFRIDHVPEAVDLISCLLEQKPFKRPQIMTVRLHPLFWTSEKRLKFLCEASDRIEIEEKETKSSILEDLEVVSQLALGCSWAEKLDDVFIQNLGKYRKYNYNSIRDLLRVIRNKSNHFRELPQEVQSMFSSHPEGFEIYFRNKFPRLLLEVFKVMERHCKHEEGFQKYFLHDFMLQK
ncbi:hypothetical protein KP509_20G085200 [Ceratopteris richardii]|nr:hypothetical protein KP509_20G085200 [Ceratopteris richardii]KAH7332403.1 hypothetical protein KP509_20G085200 [Ceratopteris richardii]